MENNIVQDFQNLRVFSNHNINRMDELVHDLSQALEETAKSGARSGNCQENSISSGAVARRLHKRRRGARRAAVNVYWKRGTISEASESSIDEAIRDYIDNSVVTHSDSDDLALAYPKQRLMVPLTEPIPPAVESDSFTENLSPMRPQRRRRRYKHMAVDSYSSQGRPDASGDGQSDRCTTPTSTPTSEHHRPSRHHPVATGGSSSKGGLQTVVPGKRKRCSKSRSELTVAKDHKPVEDKDIADMDNMDVGSVSQESSLSSSEFDTNDSDVYNHGDEGREADDEQSDFFHEPDGVSGIPEIIPWWETKDMMDESMGTGKKEFDAVLSGALSHMPVTSQKSFRRRLDKMIARAESGREIRIGRRKLKERMPRYTMMRFLQEREHWNTMQGSSPAGSHFSPGASWNSGYCSQSGDYKRLRQTPPPLDDTEEEDIGFLTLEEPGARSPPRLLEAKIIETILRDDDEDTQPGAPITFRQHLLKQLAKYELETQSDT